MVITLGDQAVQFMAGSKSIIPALKVEARDTTGAGDILTPLWPSAWQRGNAHKAVNSGLRIGLSVRRTCPDSILIGIRY